MNATLTRKKSVPVRVLSRNAASAHAFIGDAPRNHRGGHHIYRALSKSF